MSELKLNRGYLYCSAYQRLATATNSGQIQAINKKQDSTL
jgi:hypothetical protein